MRGKLGYWLVLPRTPFLLGITALFCRRLARPNVLWTQRSAELFFVAAISLPISWVVIDLLTPYTTPRRLPRGGRAEVRKPAAQAAKASAMSGFVPLPELRRSARPTSIMKIGTTGDGL